MSRRAAIPRRRPSTAPSLEEGAVLPTACANVKQLASADQRLNARGEAIVEKVVRCRPVRGLGDREAAITNAANVVCLGQGFGMARGSGNSPKPQAMAMARGHGHGLGPSLWPGKLNIKILLYFG